MSKDTVIDATNPGEGKRDELTDLLREGAKRLIAEAVDAELATMLRQFVDYKDQSGRRFVVRNGHLPEREIMTGIGPVSVQVPKVRDRSGGGIKFTSAPSTTVSETCSERRGGVALAIPERDIYWRYARSAGSPFGKRSQRAVTSNDQSPQSQVGGRLPVLESAGPLR